MKKFEKLKKLLIIIVIVVLLEVTLFNFRYYLIKFSRLENDVLETKRENLTSYEHKDFTFNKTYTIKLNRKVKGIKLNITQNNKEKEIKIIPKFKDEGLKFEEKELEEIVYLPSFKNRNYIVLNSQENCLELQFEMESTGNFHIQSIELNTWYFEFNWLRVCGLILISLFIMYRKEINNFFEKNPQYKKFVYIGFIVISTILFIFYSNGYGKAYEKSSWESGMVLKDMYRELTRSIMHGRITIDFPKNYREELSQLQNYQDYSERVETGKKYLYDAAFYKGNYYCYYGIIPVVTVLLPIAVITGIFYYSNVICIFYGTLIMILLLKIYLEILKKFKAKFEFILEFIGYLTLILSMELFILKAEPNFYQAVDLCGVFWNLFTFWKILSLENNEKIKQKLFLIGLSFGCMVLTRPLYVFYIIPIIIAVWKHLVKNKKIQWKNLSIFTLPIIVMAIFQMWYNYARYENIFEFGQFCQITVNDSSTLELDPGLALDGILSFLFNPPVIMRHFPFIGYNNGGVMTGNEILSMDILGIFWNPFMLILLVTTIKIKRIIKNKKLYIYTIVLWIITLIILSLNTCWGGMHQRYLSDVLPSLTILSLIYWLLYIKESKNEEIKNERKNIYKFVCTSSVIVMLLLAFVKINIFMFKPIENRQIDKRVIEYNIKHSLEFYK